jgi:hypothetical protein
VGSRFAGEVSARFWPPIGLFLLYVCLKARISLKFICSMEYGLTQLVLGCEHFLPISEEEFVRTKLARGRSIKALDTEEKLDMVLQNYVEYEHELLQITLRNALFSPGDWSDFRGIIHQIDRRLVNLLSTSRLYIDQLRHDALSLIEANDSDTDSVRAITSPEYNARLGYRVMEALRNHVQHRGLPLHSISFGGGWIDTQKGRRREEKTTLYLNVDILANDKKFKREVLEELKGADHKLPLKPLVREYITGLIRVQQVIREKLKKVVMDDDTWLKSLVDRYRSEAGDGILGLAAVARRSNGTYEDEVGVSMNFVDRRKLLARKNDGAGELSTLIVTSE